jgi:hypothetical protein
MALIWVHADATERRTGSRAFSSGCDQHSISRKRVKVWRRFLRSRAEEGPLPATESESGVRRREGEERERRRSERRREVARVDEGRKDLVSRVEGAEG